MVEQCMTHSLLLHIIPHSLWFLFAFHTEENKTNRSCEIEKIVQNRPKLCQIYPYDSSVLANKWQNVHLHEKYRSQSYVRKLLWRSICGTPCHDIRCSNTMLLNKPYQ